MFEKTRSLILFVEQDGPAAIFLLPTAASILLLTPRLSARYADGAGAALSRLPRPELVALAVLILSWAGGGLIYHDHPLTLDEYVPTVQAEIYRSGALAGTFPAPPVGEFDNYFPYFFTYDEPTGAFTQYYRPVHAALLALTGAFGVDDFLNPFAAAVTVLATAQVARLLAPERAEAPALSALLLATSAQFLAFAISDYPWSIHLALNMVWLALFLRGGVVALTGAVVIGVLATGLHQVQPHAAFAFPVLAAFAFGWRRRLPWARHLALCALICAIYCLAIGFWLVWDNLALWLHTGEDRFLPESLGEVLALRPFLDGQLRQIDFLPTLYSLLNVANILRLVLWLSPAVVFLLVLGLVRGRRPSADTVVLIAVFLFSLAVYMILMPNQMLGWGYRYLTPLLGIMAILAALALPGQDDPPRPSAVVATMAWIAVGAGLFLPLRAAQIEALVRPEAQLAERIRTSPSAFSVNQVSEVMMTTQLVRNAPDLSNRPLALTDLHLPLEFFEEEAERLELLTIREFGAAGLFVVERPFLYHPPGTSKFDHYVTCDPAPPPGLTPEELTDWRPQGPDLFTHCEVQRDSETFRATRQDPDSRR